MTNSQKWLCKMGFHDAYMTRGLLGYDLKWRICGLVRYPDGWAKYDLRHVDGGKAL